jgi:hypothetical protein
MWLLARDGVNAENCRYARKQNRIREYTRKRFLMSCHSIITKHVQYNMSSFSIGIETPSPDTGSLLVSEKLWRSLNPYRERRHIILNMFSDYWIAGHEETFTCIFSYSILLPSVMVFVGVCPWCYTCCTHRCCFSEGSWLFAWGGFVVWLSRKSKAPEYLPPSTCCMVTSG